MDIVKSLTTVNFNPGGMKAIRGIVLHSMWGTQNGSIAWFKNPDAKASAHYCISGVGEIVQVVDESKLDRAWHAGIYDEGKCPDWAMPNPNDWCIGIELEDNRSVDWSYPEPQREALRFLVTNLMDRYSIPRDHVLLHRDLNPSRRSDPVGQFSFDWLFGETPTVPVPSPVEKIGKDQVLKDAYTALCGGFSEDEIKWRLSQDKNLVEIMTDICNGDGRFFEKWIKPKMPVTNVPDQADESTPSFPVFTDAEAQIRIRAILANKKSLLSKISYLITFLA
jgi:hypothetical protein